MAMLLDVRAKIDLHPWRAIGVGAAIIVATAVSVILVGNVLDHVPAIVWLDSGVYEAINLGPHPTWLNAIVAPFNFNFLPWGGTFFPSFIYFVFAIGLVFIAIWHRKNFGWALLAVFIAVIFDTILFKLTNTYVVRDRPFIHLANSLSAGDKAIWTSWPTYPSGHVRDMALYSSVLIGFAPKLLWPFVILAFWIGWTRIYLGAHYPSDVFAGLVLGCLVGYGTLLIVKSARRLVNGKETVQV